jgi:simple sugar transport system ATP-binding protein
VSETLIELRDITKSYGRVYALGGVNLSVRQGEVVGLIGDNGAGKSTLIKILAGVVKPTTGEILVRGKPVHGWSAAKSREAGIETVFQDRALAVQQTIVRNIFMGRELSGPFGWLKVREEISEAGRLMREIGFTSKVFTPKSIVGQLSGGERSPKPQRSSISCARCAPAAVRSSSSVTTSTTSSRLPTASSCSTAARSRWRRPATR